MIFHAYIEALDWRGIETQPRNFVRLLHGVSHAGGACQGLAGVELQVRNGEFVGVVNGQVMCEGPDMVGASFDVLVRHARASATVTVTINARGVIDTIGGLSESLPTYQLLWVPPPRNMDGGDVPPPGWPEPPSEETDLCSTGSWTSENPGLTTHALLVQGEVYDRDATVIRRADYWFNIACAGSALAKLRLHGMDPMKNRNPGDPSAVPGASTVQQRQSALKLMTAKYCGAGGWTADGTQIFWRGPEAADPAPGAAENLLSLGPIESRWGSNGALCISHLRLWSADGVCATSLEQPRVEQIQQICNIPACDESQPCPEDGASSDASTLWWTCTANHVAHGPR